jgi:eukaryotic-like serine/threonine-protein kinase
MDAARWTRLQSLFHDAVDLPLAERERFLERECADDPSLIVEVRALLREDAAAVEAAGDAAGATILERGVAHAARSVLGASSHADLPKTSFGPYRATRLLGEGGMGVVYLARRDDLGSVAAIKILRDAWLSPSRKERFAAEQRTLAQLDHPLIARLYDADTLDDGTPWFAMEYVDGLPLAEYCALHQATIDARLRLFRQVCEAVQSAHQRLVIHRDLKPSNVLVTRDGGVKLLDFGIAKHLDATGDPATRTRTVARLLTPAYAAPEQLAGRDVGIHTDVYALGVMLYELLTGRLPFDAASRADAADFANAEPRVDPPSSIAPRGSLGRSDWGDLDVLCLTAMQHDPARRYATVDAFVRDIDHHLHREPLEARPDSVGYRARKFVRRHRQAVFAATAAGAIVIGIVAFYTARLTRARNDAVTDAARVQRIQRFTLDLFQGGDKAAGPGESLRVITMVDRGLNDARSLDGEPALQSELFLTLGTIYQQLGQLSRADSLINLSVAMRRALYGASHRDVAAALVSLGLVQVDEARFEDAERSIRQGLAMSNATLSPTDPQVIRATAALGRVLQERGAYDKAIPLLAEAAQLDEVSGAPIQDFAARLSALADAHFFAGHYAVADSLNNRVLGIYRRVYGARHPLVGDILVNLGASQFDRGNYVEAERLDREALAITRGFYGEEHYKTATGLTVLGRALVFQNRFDEATTILRQALAVREHVYGPMHPTVASTVNELGNIAMQRDRYDEAHAHFARMLSIYRATYGENHYLISVATSNLGGVEMGRKRYAAAESLFRAAVTGFTATQGKAHLNTAIARVKLGRALLRQGRFADAAIETRAGYDLLTGQANSAVSFLQNARKDLVAEYDSLRRPGEAARFKAELASVR